MTADGSPAQRHCVDGIGGFTAGRILRGWPQHVTFSEEYASEPRVTEIGGALRDGIENRLDVGWRSGHHPKDLAGRRLLVERVLEALGE